MYYLKTFILYSIVGHLIETVFFLALHINKRSGILFLWWTPLYGFGAVISLFVYKLVSKEIKNKFGKIITLFLIYFILFTLLEIMGGQFIEKIFDYEMWNYTDLFWHIGKYASVPTSLLWAGMSLVYVYFFKKLTDFIIERTPNFLTILLFIIFIIDVFLSLLKAFY